MSSRRGFGRRSQGQNTANPLNSFVSVINRRAGSQTKVSERYGFTNDENDGSLLSNTQKHQKLQDYKSKHKFKEVSPFRAQKQRVPIVAALGSDSSAFSPARSTRRPTGTPLRSKKATPRRTRNGKSQASSEYRSPKFSKSPFAKVSFARAASPGPNYAARRQRVAQESKNVYVRDQIKFE